MKRFKLLSMLLAILVIPMIISCGDDDEKNNTPSGDDLIIKASGTWMCTQSVDAQNGKSYQDLMVGKEITINPNGTYTSTAPSFGYSGSYTVSGNKITAHSDAGATFLINVSISGDRMTWDGTANNGVTFRYVFERESNDVPTEKAFTKEIIAGDFQWNVRSVDIKRGYSSHIEKDKTIRFYDDGTCEAFHSMETAWRINNGRIETYYKQTEEPIFVYTLLSANNDEIIVRINGTLDDILQAEVVLVKDSIPNTGTTEENVFDSNNNILNIYNSCYASCAEFETAQIKLESIRLNPTTAHQITPNSPEVSDVWQRAYQTINRINLVLEKEDMVISLMGSQKGKTLIAELKALRAFVNYNLAMLWGNVPLLTRAITDIDNSIAQTNQSEVFQFALDEINNAIDYLPVNEGQENGRLYFNKDAGRMLKAELQMVLGKKAQAKATLNQIESNSYITTRSTSTSLEKSYIWALHQQTNNYCPIYTLTHNQLYLYEITGSKDDLVLPYINIGGSPANNIESYWQALDYLDYGCWAALKRMGKAQEITGCFDYELLMPIPHEDIVSNKNLTQNPGY